MTVQSTATTTGSLPSKKQRSTKQRTWLAACAVALGVAILAGSGAWLALGHGQGSSPHATQAVTAPVAGVTLSQPAAAIAAEQSPTYYLTDSQAAADGAQAALDDANAIRATAQVPPLSAVVVVAGSSEAAAQTNAAMSDLQAIRATLAAPPLALIDLRGGR